MVNNFSKSNLENIKTIINSDIVKNIQDILVQQKTTSYLVGGSIRDALIGNPLQDIDISISCNPLDTGLKIANSLNGKLISLHSPSKLFRIIVNHPNSSLNIDLTQTKGDIKSDLQKRDFTINSLAIPLSVQNKKADPIIIDPFNGIEDIRKKTIRLVEQNAINDDPLRMLRAQRLAASLKFSIDNKTKIDIREKSSKLTSVSPERIRDEFLTILSCKNVGNSLYELDNLNLLNILIPELIDCKKIIQPQYHHWDVFNHSIQTAEYIGYIIQETPIENYDLPFDFLQYTNSVKNYFETPYSDNQNKLTLLKLAALLHDIGKPTTEFKDDSGKISFIGHDKKGSEITEKILDRLRLSKHGIEYINKLVFYHLRPNQISNNQNLPSKKALYRYFRDLGNISCDILYLSLADYLSARGPNISIEEWNWQRKLMKYIYNNHNTNIDNKPYNYMDGKEIMKKFNLQSGPIVGRLIEYANEAYHTGEIKNKKQAFSFLDKKLKKGDYIA